MIQTIRKAWGIPELRKKIIFTLLILLIFRIGNAITVPYVDVGLLETYLDQMGGTILGLYNVMSGGAFAQATVFALSIQPYINASIIIQLLTVAIPALERLAKDGGEEGRKKIQSITRYTTVGIAILQAVGYYFMMRNYNLLASDATGIWPALVIVVSFIAGSSFVMWMGEQVTEFGIGNGISIILFAGILSRIPTSVSSLYSGVVSWANGGAAADGALHPALVVLLLVGVLALVVFVVFISDAERRIPVQYAKRQVGRKMYGGQQQRVALARALVMRPGLLLLDEPLSNLDAKLRESMRFEISSIQKELGITVIYVTHDQSEAMTMSDRVVVMSRGVIQQIGTPYEIYRNPANKMVADFIGLVNFVEGEVQGDRVYISGTGVSFPNTSGITGSATIAVRPENITMSRTSGTIEGTLVHRFYLGDAVDYRVQCKHHVIRVIVKGAELKEFTDGEKVYLDFDKIMVFDRD